MPAETCAMSGTPAPKCKTTKRCPLFQCGEVKVYGSGLVSSHAESEYALKGAWEVKGKSAEDCKERPVAEWRPFDMRRICETDFEIHHFQPLYYVLESYEQLRDAMNEYAEQVIGSAGMAAAGRR